MRPDAASRQCGLDRLLVTAQMIEHPGFVGEPGGGPGIAGTKAPPRLDRVESFLVPAVEAQCDSKIKITESEVAVELNGAARTSPAHRLVWASTYWACGFSLSSATA